MHLFKQNEKRGYDHFPQKSEFWTDVRSWDRHTWWRSKNLINCIFWSKMGPCVTHTVCAFVLFRLQCIHTSRNPNLKFKNWFRHSGTQLGLQKRKHWSQFFDFIYWPCIAVQAVQKLKNSLNFHGRNKLKLLKAVDEIKIWLKHCDQCLFLQPILSASISKYFFEFQTWITTKYVLLSNSFRGTKSPI